MSLCHFCGKPAGVFKRHHQACRQKYLQAKEQIPKLFEKLPYSSIDSSRFVELLGTAAMSAGVREDELNALAIEGILGMINSIIEQRILAAHDEIRIAEILEALAIPLESAPVLERLFLKAQILREMAEGKVSERVVVEDPLPFKLRVSERVIWVFNRTAGYLHQGQGDGAKDLRPIAEYYAKEWFRDAAATEMWEREYRGDILLTNYNLYILDASARHARIAISRLLDISPYTNAVKLTFGAKPRQMTCVVNDPWFLTNSTAILYRNLMARRELGD